MSLELEILSSHFLATFFTFGCIWGQAHQNCACPELPEPPELPLATTFLSIYTNF